MLAVKERSKRATAGRRASNLDGKALEEDEAFWKEDVWQEDDGHDAYIDETERDEFDGDFDDSEHEEEEEEEEEVDSANGNELNNDDRQEEEEKDTKVALESNGTSSAATASKQPVSKTWSSSIVRAWNEFFHARTTPATCQLGGAMRIAFAFLFLCDRLLWHLDLNFLLSPSEGLIPYEVGQHRIWHYHYSLLELAPESDAWLWTVHGMSLVCGVLLLLGIAPRVQMVAIFIIIVSFENSNSLCFDGQDFMFRIWASLLVYFPLHRYSIWGIWRKTKANSTKDEDTDSWPMWPFRLLQIQMCFIYTGAGWGKLMNGTNWISGNALWRVSHMNDFYGGVFNPEFIFNVLGPLKFLCWSSLLVETTCWILIWPKATRIPTLIGVVGLHVGIDLAMNMHCFEWLTILGWMSFLASPTAAASASEPLMAKDTQRNDTPIQIPKKQRFYRCFVNLFLATLLTYNWGSTNAGIYLQNAAPPTLKPLAKAYKDVGNWIAEVCDPVASLLGIRQDEWDMFSGMVDTRHKAFMINLTLADGEVIESSSPDWDSMTWWQKKRYMRPMDYIEYLSSEEQPEAHKAICRSFAKEYENVATVELSFAWRDGPDAPPDDLGLWDYPARQPLTEFYVESYLTLNVNANLHEMCGKWAEEGECEHHANPVYMWQDCVKSCLAQGLDHPELVKVGDRLVITVDKKIYFAPPCTAVVRRADRLGKYRLKVDDDRCKGFEKEWVNLYEHKFKIAQERDAVKEKKEEL